MVEVPKYERTQRCKIEELAIFNNSTIFIGIDLGDKLSNFDILDKDGEVIEESLIPTTKNAFTRKFTHFTPSRIAMEVGTHSRWISQTLKDLGHEVIVADAPKLSLTYDNPRKDDKVDAEYLARLARLDLKLLLPVFHHSREAKAHLGVIRSRDILVRTRTLLINHVRNMVKSTGAGRRSILGVVKGSDPDESIGEI